ncbi:MAG: hypothetical protein PVF39_17555, partial [Desulfobacterales bacterium]|jgi:hypothetical protein
MTFSFLKNFQNRKLEDAILLNGFFLQKEIAPPIKGEALLNTATIIPNQPKSKGIVQNLSPKCQINRFQGRFRVIGLSFSVKFGKILQLTKWGITYGSLIVLPMV